MVVKRIDKKTKLISLITLLVILVLAYVLLIVLNIGAINKYNSSILPSMYLEDLDLSDYSYKQARERIVYYNDNILTKVVKFKVEESEYEYPLRDIGMSIDASRSLEQIRKYQNSLGFWEKLMALRGNTKQEYKFIYNSDVSQLTEAINGLKAKVDREVVNGHFNDNGSINCSKLFLLIL